MTTFLLFAVGASLGSFCNVCIYRIPRGIGVVTTRSFCPHCSRTLRWFELVPVLSYILFAGKCLRCRSPIPIQYPVVEIMTGLIVVMSFGELAFNPASFHAAAFLITMIVVAFTDWQRLIIPNTVLLVSFAAAVLLSALSGVGSLAGSLLSSLISFAAALVILLSGDYVFRKKTMGFGDVKLAGVVGIYIGWKLFLLVLWVSSVVGAVYGLFLILFLKKPADTKLPFGTFVAATACLMFLLKPVLQTTVARWLTHIL